MLPLAVGLVPEDHVKSVADFVVSRGDGSSNIVWVDGEPVPAAVEGNTLFVDGIGSGQHRMVHE